METNTLQSTHHFAWFRKRFVSSIVDGIANGTGIWAIVNIVIYYLHGYTLWYLIFWFQIIDSKTGNQASGTKLFLRWFVKITLSLLMIWIVWFLVAFIFWFIGTVASAEALLVETPTWWDTSLIGAIKTIINRFLWLLTLCTLLWIASPTAITVPFSKTKSWIHDMIVGTYVIKK